MGEWRELWQYARADRARITRLAIIVTCLAFLAALIVCAAVGFLIAVLA
jgi:hypothetical protein